MSRLATRVAEMERRVGVAGGAMDPDADCVMYVCFVASSGDVTGVLRLDEGGADAMQFVDRSPSGLTVGDSIWRKA